MAARGASEKELIFNVIKTIFPQMFSPDGKEFRIPVDSPEGELQFKIALTCAKENVDHDGAEASTSATVEKVAEKVELTDEEKAKVTDFLTRLGLYKA